MAEAVNELDHVVTSEEAVDPNKIAEEQMDVRRCLAFVSGGLTMFMSTEYVIEIINDHSITPLPATPDYVAGIINLRGSILPVVDIRILMGKERAEYTSKTCIIVLNIDSVPIGIVVDTVKQVLDIDMNDIQPMPMKRQQKLANGMLNLEDGTVALSFDCQSLIQG